MLAALVGVGPARVQGDTGPRAVGRAGATLVSDDGAPALLNNPGGLVRRSALRLQVGLVVDDRDLRFRALGDAPEVEDSSAPGTRPALAVIGTLGPVVAGLAYLEPEEHSRALPAAVPGRVFDATEAGRLPHRYGGIAVAQRDQRLAAGAAVRAGDWLGAGVSVDLGRTRLRERRHVWAGDDGAQLPGDPSRDLDVQVRGAGLSVGAGAGVLIAPPTAPVELAASARYTYRGRLRGPAGAARVGNTTDQPVDPEVALDQPEAEVTLPDVLALRAGARYLGQRVLVEAAAALVLTPRAGTAWRLSGIGVDDSALGAAALTELPRLYDPGRYGAVQVAADVEVVAGFAWLTAGYGYRSSASRPGRLSPGYAEPGRHTAALGVEVYRAGITLTLGYSRSVAPAHTVTSTALRAANPYRAGTVPVGLGRYRLARDSVGVAVEVAWE
ncbi:hypothetical protein [Haliangium sp.]|uniref:hypothetical protein n=1 Tax=Haliangium sp. TaxID=2663208 RepID=UPI003D0A6136